MSSVAMAFDRRTGADGIGHCGWAFACGDDTFLVGSVENPPHSLRTSPDKMGFWAIHTRAPIRPMRERAYTQMKVIDIDQSDPAYALQVVAWHSHKPYKVVGCNCMDVTYDVLRAFGVSNLPAPAHHWEPNHWFDHVQGRLYQIDGEEVTLATDARNQAPTDFAGLALDSLLTNLPAGIMTTIPAWRAAHTPEWAELDAAMAVVPPQLATSGQLMTSRQHGLTGWIRRLFGG